MTLAVVSETALGHEGHGQHSDLMGPKGNHGLLTALRSGYLVKNTWLIPYLTVVQLSPPGDLAPSAFLSVLVLMPCRDGPFGPSLSTKRWNVSLERAALCRVWSPTGYTILFCTCISSRWSTLSGSKAIRMGMRSWDVKEMEGFNKWLQVNLGRAYVSL